MNIEEQVIASLEAALNIRLDRARTNAATPLLGALPEFDSMAVVALLATMEERLGIAVDDDEIDGSIFATVGSLTEFVRGKLAG
ncbi:acyl carrier protein [Burkholderiales bacterium GJ-E10]|nr:acyl carrier protein [Burkholderiales bacterium GJ-E10]